MTDTDWDDCWSEFAASEDFKRLKERLREEQEFEQCESLLDDWTETGLIDGSTWEWIYYW